MNYKEQLKEAYVNGFITARRNLTMDALFAFNKWYPIHCRKLELQEFSKKKMKRTK